jgi:site-specific recombinase XerD
MQQCEASEAAAALIPWFCDVLTSPKSRRDYYGDLSRFLSVMRQQGVHPYNVTGDHVRLYKEAMKEQGNKAATIARALSVIRGTYEQFGKKGLVDWQTIGDIQAVKTPKVDKGTTPSLSEKEAIALLHAPDKSTLIGLRDHAMLFAYFKTACRFAAIANAKVGDLERTDTEWFLLVARQATLTPTRKENAMFMLFAGAMFVINIGLIGAGLATYQP